MRKQLAVLCALPLLILFLPCCAVKDPPVAGKQYTYSGESAFGLGNDPFTIAIDGDGTYTYSESLLSSYIGTGEWSVSGGALTLADGDGATPRVNRFLIVGDDLYFVEEGSSNFIHVKVKDGERFHGAARVGA